MLGEVGRSPERFPVYGLLASALVVSAWSPRFGLGLAVAIPLAELTPLLPSTTTNDWPVYQLALFVVAIAAFREDRRLRLPAAVAAVVIAVAVVLSWFAGEHIPQLSWRWIALWWQGELDWQVPVALAPTLLRLLPIALLGTVGAWGIGVATGFLSREQGRRISFARARDELRMSEQQRQLAEERESIAQDLHDVLAHSLAVIIVQGEAALAEAGPRRLETERAAGAEGVDSAEHAAGTERTVDAAPASAALSRIVELARHSLADLRRLIEQLDGESLQEPSPGLDDLDALLAPLRALGMGIELRELGDRPELPASVQLAVYRILQEALTNALKHDGATAAVRIDLDWRGDDLLLFISSRTLAGPADSAGPAGRPVGATGSDGDDALPATAHRGLRGMRARARLAGGWLAAAHDGEEFIVTAVIPHGPAADQAPTSEPIAATPFHAGATS